MTISTSPALDETASRLDAAAVRADFPIFDVEVYDKPVVFLDSAASAQKPRAVIDAVSTCYERYYANVHRGVYKFSQESTLAFEGARNTVAKFLN
ncbi:MAG: aminotransferase class V-fold PLP-dependent enzyme, partial [Alphaproteobacteria bacterium]